MTDFTSPSRAERPVKRGFGGNDDTNQLPGEAINLSTSLLHSKSNLNNYDLTNSGMLQ